MNPINYDTLSLDELRQYILTHREDTMGFYAYIDLWKADGRMIIVGLEDNYWEEKITPQIQEGQS